MAKYKNISDRTITVGNVFGKITAKPGGVFLTAKKFALSLLAAKLIEEVKEEVSDRRTKKTAKAQTKKEGDK